MRLVIRASAEGPTGRLFFFHTRAPGLPFRRYGRAAFWNLGVSEAGHGGLGLELFEQGMSEVSLRTALEGRKHASAACREQRPFPEP